MDEEGISELLAQTREGNPGARDELFTLVYEQLHSLASKMMYDQAAQHTLQATALVHEAYIRLKGAGTSWNDEVHFRHIAASAMRCVIIDSARARRATKRGGEARRVDTLEIRAMSGPQSDLLELDELLQGLARLDARTAQVFEMRCFGGYSHDEIAQSLELSLSTVERRWRFARTWLQSKMDSTSAS